MGSPIQLLCHQRGALGLRLGCGPGLRPVRAMEQVQQLFETHSFWGQGRSMAGLHRMLRGSEAVVSAWHDDVLVGFGRATSDGTYRAVLWDVMVARHQEGQGLGRRLVAALLAAPPVASAERVYLMTTNSHGFYERLGFHEATSQRLMRLG
ncbi:GNAT family N-acetyltransferase [Synechococcus sp. Lug-A]|uniref:GNAT family N-acetyltransferase n=1 Tax=Synechococcus sp. Lug-A TaxID=2823740 RepID=UPI0020CC2C0C|nr:GNAT family N-acetyltransferase [Synechococcus sp. Lug-A]